MRDSKKLSKETFKAMVLRSCDFHPGIQRRRRAPRRGSPRTRDKSDINE